MNTLNSAGRRGSALVLALVAFLFMAGIGGAIFSLTLSGRRTTMAASFGDGAYHVAEAGIDDAINKIRGYIADSSNTGADYAVIGGTPVKDESGNVVTQFSGEVRSGTYTISIQPPFELGKIQDYKISSVGVLAGVARGISTWISAEEAPGAFKYGLFGDVYLDAGGNIKTDGFDSTKGKYTAQLTTTVDGTQFANKTGHVGSNGNVDVSGSSQIYGNATPGPNDSVTGGGKVYGSTDPAKQALSLSPPDFTVPAGATKKAAIGASTTLNAGVYSVPSVSPNGKSVVTINGDVTLYVDGDFVFTGQPQLKITAGSKLTVYQNSKDGTAKFTVAGGSVVNTDLSPNALTMYTNTKSGKLTGNSDFYGTIYAPSTAMSILGTAGLYGSTIAKTIDIQGTPFFHYDESLGAIKTGEVQINVKSVEQFVPSASATSSK